MGNRKMRFITYPGHTHLPHQYKPYPPPLHGGFTAEELPCSGGTCMRVQVICLRSGQGNDCQLINSLAGE